MTRAMTGRRARRARPAASQPRLPMPPQLLAATATPDIVTVPTRAVVTLDGVGAPEDAAFQRSVAAVYGVAYTVKFARKRSGKPDFAIGPLEGRWWTDEPSRALPEVPRGAWRWELRLAVPGGVTEAEVARAIAAATGRRGGKLEGSAEAARVRRVRLPATAYGRVLHVGPYSREGESFARIVELLERAGRRAANAHLEIYLNDPRRVAPEKLKTALLLELAP
jgi:hypothetical protein